MGRQPSRLWKPITAALLGLAMSLPSCGSVGGYMKDRIMDFSDIVDVKYGYGFGLGAKVETTLYVGAGAGVGFISQGREWYGRRSIADYDQWFVHFVLGGWDGSQVPFDRGGTATDWYGIVLPVNLSALDHPWSPPMLQRWRFGFEFLVPFVNFGLYLNGGEVGDFFVGFSTLDIADDDGVSLTEVYGDDFQPLGP
jgi:hypothetical protein